MEQSLTLSQFQQVLGNAIRTTRGLQNVWVQAEFADLRINGGHCYMELIEKDATGTTRAKIRAMIWSSTLGMLRRKFFEATGSDLASGMKVLVKGSATHHNLYGLSFTISDIDPSFTLGDMQRIRREILERLTREGVIDHNKSLTPPPVPQRIAVISSETAAGYGDFVNQLQSNPEGFVLYPTLIPAVLQGERTAPSIIQALDIVESTLHMWDAVVIIRGGGATTDLNGFDNYELAHRVATFPLPVIVGIGHERDRTVLDEIACVRCKTPTAVAAWLIDALRNAYAAATERVLRISNYCSSAMRGEHIRLTHISQQIPMSARAVINTNKLILNTLAQTLPVRVQGRLADKRVALAGYEARLKAGAASVSANEQARLQRFADMLRLLSPDNTLKRGYSITRVNGKAVSSVADLPEGTVIETTLSDGTVTSQVTDSYEPE